MKKQYTKRQIFESIKYWKRMLEEIESPTEKIIQALAVGKLNDEAFGSVGIYNDNGIFWDMPNSQSNKFVIIVSNIDRFNDRYICDVMGGPDNKQFQDFGIQDFSIENMPAQYDFDDIVHNASNKYGVKLGSMNGFRNALDAYNNIASSYELGETKMKKRYTKRQIQESIAYWKKQLKRMNESQSMHHYVVDVTSSLGSIGEEYDADSLEDLASQIRAKLAWMNGAEDDTNTSWIPFEYISVEDENGNDVTEEANESK